MDASTREGYHAAAPKEFLDESGSSSESNLNSSEVPSDNKALIYDPEKWVIIDTFPNFQDHNKYDFRTPEAAEKLHTLGFQEVQWREEPTTPDSFSPFPRLPVELRRQVWKQALPAPRIILLEFYDRDSRSQPEAPLDYDIDISTVGDKGVSRHVLLSICRESRELFLESYTKIQCDGLTSRSIQLELFRGFTTWQDTDILEVHTNIGEVRLHWHGYIDFRRDTVRLGQYELLSKVWTLSRAGCKIFKGIQKLALDVDVSLPARSTANSPNNPLPQSRHLLYAVRMNFPHLREFSFTATYPATQDSADIWHKYWSNSKDRKQHHITVDDQLSQILIHNSELALQEFRENRQRLRETSVQLTNLARRLNRLPLNRRRSERFWKKVKVSTSIPCWFYRCHNAEAAPEQKMLLLKPQKSQDHDADLKYYTIKPRAPPTAYFVFLLLPDYHWFPCESDGQLIDTSYDGIKEMFEEPEDEVAIPAAIAAASVVGDFQTATAGRWLINHDSDD